MSEAKFLSVDSYVDFVGLLRLKDLEQALISYKGTDQYDAVLRYYFGCIASLDSPQMLEPLGLLKQALGALLGGSRRRRTPELPSGPEGAGAENLRQIHDKIEHFEARLHNSFELLRLPSTEVPKNLHFVWLGGGVGAIQRDYINIWKQVMGAEGYHLNLWHDSDALLAYETNRIIVEAAKADAMLHGGQDSVDGVALGDRYEERAIVLKQQMYGHITKAVKNGGSADEARIDLLVRAYGQDEARLMALRDANRLSLQALAGDHLALRDLANGETPLQLKDIYAREISLRGNFAAASDVVRIEALSAEGGSYADVDNLPPLLEELGGVDIRAFKTDARLGVLQLMLDRNPEWMPGRQALRGRYTDYFEMIPPEHREALERFADSRPGLDRVFRTPVERQARPDELRAVAEQSSLSNAFLMAHPESAMLQAVFERFRLNYEIVDATARLADEQNVALTDAVAMSKLAKQAATKVFGAFHELEPEVEMAAAFLVEAAATYYSDGIRPQSEVTIYLTGPSAMREGMRAYQQAHFTPGTAEMWRAATAIPAVATVNRATEEELDHSWKENESDLGQWLENEKKCWQEGRFEARYAGELAELLKYRTLRFDEGWPLIEGRHVLSTDLLQHLADELGAPFMQAMNRCHNGVVTFDKAIPLGFDERQSIRAQSAGVLPPASLSDPQAQQWSIAELLNRLAEGHFEIAQLSPLQRLLLGALTGAKALDNRSFDTIHPQLDNLANNFSKPGTAGSYATIERALYQQQAPAFLAGLASAADYPPGHDETALGLKKVALEQPLTLRQWGQQVARIQQAAKLEHRVRIIERVGVVLDGFEAGTIKLVPQDLLLQGEGDRVGGRCYPLALAMAAALSEGSAAVNTLRERFFLGVIEPEASDSLTFLSSVESLRDVQLSEVGRALARSNLNEVVDVLQARATTATLMLNSDNHAMLVAKTFEGERSTYHFYDPNFGVFEFEDSTLFKQALEQFFLEQDMARYYAAYGDATHPTFDLIELDGARISSMPIRGEMTVSHLIRPGALPEESSLPVRQRTARARGKSLQSHPELRSSLLALDGHWWAQQISEATTHLRQTNELTSSFVPLFDSLETVPEEGYRIALFDRDHPVEPVFVKTKDPRFKRIKVYLTEHFSAMGAKHSDMLIEPTHVGGVHTLNAGFSILALMQALQSREGDDHSLTLAVRLHAYVGYAQLGQGLVSDFNALVGLVREALKNERLIAATVSPAVKASLGSSVSEATSGLLQFVSFGLDIYQLSNAQNGIERAEFGTQLAFDTASLLLWGAAYVSGATAGAILGGAAVIVGGLAFGVSAVVEGFAMIAEEAAQVGLFFDEVEKAHLHAYKFDPVHKLWKPDSDLVVTVMDLRRGVLTVGGPKLYPQRDHIGVPTIYFDYERAIDIRKELDLPGEVAFRPAAENAIVLPYIPHHCYNYEYKALPLANSYHWTGFDTARRLEKWQEQDGQWLFQFSFYSFPSHQIVHKLYNPDFRPTTFDVWLDAVDRSLLVPKLQPVWMDKIQYHIHGAGKRCAVVLQPGVSLILETTAPLESTWVLDAPWAKESDIRFASNDKLFIGEVAVSVTGAGHDAILLRINEDQMFKVEEGKLSGVVLSMPRDLDPQAWREHLKTLGKQHRLAMPYTTVHEYLVPFEKPDEPRYVTAWYDAKKDRYLYLRDDLPSAVDAELGAVTEGYAWFYKRDDIWIWQVDANTGLLIQRYRLRCPQSMSSEIESVEVDAHGMICLVQRITHEDGVRDALGYVIHDGTLLLGSVTRDRDDLLESVFNAAGTLADWSSVLRKAFVLPSDFAEDGPFDTAIWQPAPFVSVCWKIENDLRDMAWVRSSDRLIIRPSPRPKQYRGWPDSIKNLSDLTLLPPEDGSDTFIIYDRNHQTLCSKQRTLVEGKGQWSIRWKRPAKMKNIVTTDTGYVVVGEDGLFFNLTPQFELALAGLGELWLKDRTHWWSELGALARKYKTDRFAITGLTNATDDAKLCAWYVDGRLLLADLGRTNEVRLLTVIADSEAAWLFDVYRGEVYRQAFIDPQELETAFGLGSKLLRADAIPAAKREWAPQRFLTLTADGPGLRGATFEGVIVKLRAHEPPLITGVTHEWVVIHGDQEREALEQLAARPSRSALLTVEDPDYFKWFVAETGELIHLSRTALPQAFDVLGTLRRNNILLHENQNGKLLTFPVKGHLGPLSYVQREGEVLAIEGHEMKIDDLLPLIPDDITSLILRMGQGAVSYRLSKAAWLRLGSVILDCRHSLSGAAIIPGKLIWELDDPAPLLLSKVDEHLVIIDPDSGHSVIVREVYATDVNFRGDALLSFGGSRHYAVSTLVERLSVLPNAQAGITLKELLEGSTVEESNLM